VEFEDAGDADKFSVGRYTFRAVSTPGHTRGHLCLYEPDVKVLISGDHVLDTITPNISGWWGGADPLGDFLGSLDKIAGYEAGLVLSSHRNAMTDHPRRVAELKAHHEARLREVMAILRDAGQTAYEVASRMHWNIDARRWSDFPIPQQWFATGEALSHLLFLAGVGKATTNGSETPVRFSLLA
jgi:glyoxylase-like metal-dependent hydrolase (beta-lactamase superfamily II)